MKKIFYKIFFNCIFIFLLSFSSLVFADQFKAPYVSFDIGKNWTCKSFGTDWVCHNRLFKGASPAFILVTAKTSTPSDNLDLYTKTFQSIHTKNVQIKKKHLNNHLWLDSFTQRSFYNDIGRQLGTVCCKHTNEKIRVLVGFYANKKLFAKYANNFLKAIKTLKLTPNMKQAIQNMKGLSTDPQEMSSYIENILFEADAEAYLFNQAKTSKLRSNLLWIFFSILILGSLGSLSFYLLYFKKKKAK